MEIRRVLSQQLAKKQGKNLTIVEDVYIVPDQVHQGIDYFVGGFEYTNKECRCELVLRDGDIDTPLACGYGPSFNLRVKYDVIGDGLKTIVIRLLNGDSGKLHMTAGWYGESNG